MAGESGACIESTGMNTLREIRVAREMAGVGPSGGPVYRECVHPVTVTESQNSQTDNRSVTSVNQAPSTMSRVSFDLNKTSHRPANPSCGDKLIVENESLSLSLSLFLCVSLL